MHELVGSMPLSWLSICIQAANLCVAQSKRHLGKTTWLAALFLPVAFLHTYFNRISPVTVHRVLIYARGILCSSLHYSAMMSTTLQIKSSSSYALHNWNNILFHSIFTKQWLNDNQHHICKFCLTLLDRSKRGWHLCAARRIRLLSRLLKFTQISNKNISVAHLLQYYKAFKRPVE